MKIFLSVVGFFIYEKMNLTFLSMASIKVFFSGRFLCTFFLKIWVGLQLFGISVQILLLFPFLKCPFANLKVIQEGSKNAFSPELSE